MNSGEPLTGGGGVGRDGDTRLEPLADEPGHATAQAGGRHRRCRRASGRAGRSGGSGRVASDWRSAGRGRSGRSRARRWRRACRVDGTAGAVARMQRVVCRYSAVSALDGRRLRARPSSSAVIGPPATAGRRSALGAAAASGAARLSSARRLLAGFLVTRDADDRRLDAGRDEGAVVRGEDVEQEQVLPGDGGGDEVQRRGDDGARLVAGRQLAGDRPGGGRRGDRIGVGTERDPLAADRGRRGRGGRVGVLGVLDRGVAPGRLAEVGDPDLDVDSAPARELGPARCDDLGVEVAGDPHDEVRQHRLGAGVVGHAVRVVQGHGQPVAPGGRGRRDLELQRRLADLDLDGLDDVTEALRRHEVQVGRTGPLRRLGRRLGAAARGSGRDARLARGRRVGAGAASSDAAGLASAAGVAVRRAAAASGAAVTSAAGSAATGSSASQRTLAISFFGSSLRFADLVVQPVLERRVDGRDVRDRRLAHRPSRRTRGSGPAMPHR